MLELYASAKQQHQGAGGTRGDGRPYALHRVNVRAGEQKRPDSLALNPNGKVPVLVVPRRKAVRWC